MAEMENQQLPEKKEEFLGLGSLLFEMVKVFLLAVVIIIPVRVFLFQPFFVQGSSMEPNFQDGQYLVISELGYKETRLDLFGSLGLHIEPFKEIGRQDVAVFHYPLHPEQYFIKRIIGLPGESVEISKNKVIIYNQEHPEGFVLDESAYLSPEILMPDMAKVTLSDDQYFVMGDNRLYSYDSRAIGPIPKEKMIGRVLLRAWPVNKASLY